jgi:hypothetical protein
MQGLVCIECFVNDEREVTKRVPQHAKHGIREQHAHTMKPHQANIDT